MSLSLYVTPRLYGVDRSGDGPLDPRGMVFGWIYRGIGERAGGTKGGKEKELGSRKVHSGGICTPKCPRVQAIGAGQSLDADRRDVLVRVGRDPKTIDSER